MINLEAPGHKRNCAQEAMTCREIPRRITETVVSCFSSAIEKIVRVAGSLLNVLGYLLAQADNCLVSLANRARNYCLGKKEVEGEDVDIIPREFIEGEESKAARPPERQFRQIICITEKDRETAEKDRENAVADDSDEEDEVLGVDTDKPRRLPKICPVKFETLKPVEPPLPC